MATRLGDHMRERVAAFGHMGPAIVQSAVGAGLAWTAAIHLLGHPRPFFAPISVLICLGVGLGQRLRRVIELVVGVSLGVGVGDLLVAWIGSGAWQLALVVALAMGTATLLNGAPLFVAQSGSSAVLVATLVPGAGGGGLDRMLDALTGGVIAIAAVALLPISPFTLAARHASAVLDALSTVLERAADAIERGDADLAAEALAVGRGTQSTVEDFQQALVTSKEVALVSPLHWHRRTRLARYQKASVPIDHALRNARVLARRTLASLGEATPPPVSLAASMREVSEAALLLQLELAAGRDPVLTRQALTATAGRQRPERLGFSADVIVAQLRSIVVDLMLATGADPETAGAALAPVEGPGTTTDTTTDAEN
ncbi:FUSC family protein [Nonomuraea sp. 3-1Str]|uniref:FUSC family protein n=1 Tax=Nonomuraea sp. 3-1Str TaxID=2929801 RepID=UPI0028578CF8|nr:FUSC family protein [Nonomuraea sp. 3-1Str]MDR8412508.1 FUSC family protein [Nonomuraea sp. 3-1Str]